jgi:hypothetical protein
MKREFQHEVKDLQTGERAQSSRCQTRRAAAFALLTLEIRADDPQMFSQLSTLVEGLQVKTAHYRLLIPLHQETPNNPALN